MKAPTRVEAFELRKAEARQRLSVLRANDPSHYISPVPKDISPAALKARQGFDLDAAMEALPPANALKTSDRGAAGVRLRAQLKSDISEDLLREFARDTLGAKRCSAVYLNALRIVLGNQADAEQKGYVLELNRRVSFAPEKVMRTILGQMQAAGITFGSAVGLGEGRAQTVQCFDNSERVPYLRDNVASAVAAAALERIDRAQEAKDDARRAAEGKDWSCGLDLGITDADVPY
jgi:hypothetical protein